MLTIICLVNVCPTTPNYSIFFLVMRMFRIYSLSNSQICDTVPTVTMLYLITP